jgi:hypothetical protein
MSNTLKLAFVVTVLTAATALWGCASSDVQPPEDFGAACEVTAASVAECPNASDLERQARDADDYKNEPALGYLNSPPGLLPVPVSARNSSAN